MEQTDENNVFEHLLNIEAEASGIVEKAQAEADHRISEAEKHNRSMYEEAYSAEVNRLETAFIEEITAEREAHNKKLINYKKELMNKPLDKAAFFSLVSQNLRKE